MKQKKILSAFLAVVMAMVLVLPIAASGINSAAEVEYKTFQESGLTVTANWGTRGEVSTFLSPYASDFYTGNNTYEVLSTISGGTSQTDAHQSELYKALSGLMKQKHSHITSYGETRPLYRYTDCQGNDTSTISSFYSGVSLNGTWDSGATWNREHTWPNSKGLNGSDENDIMMLRPTSVKENSSRGNKAYGESVGYFDPGADVRGDCARITLYVYTRWGNTGRMWGTDGVMESVEVLLRWMQEDPVDTWEMGRNDAVQSITGTRNAFVDYPEYAFLLFGQEVPEDMVSPSKTERTEEKKAVINYQLPDGVNKVENIYAVGDTVTLATLTEVPEGFVFYGWSLGEGSSVNEAPEVFTTYLLTQENTTFYAVYMSINTGISYYTTNPKEAVPDATQPTQPEVTGPSAAPSVKPTEPIAQQPKEEPFPITVVIVVAVVVAGVAVAAVIILRKKK